jgi:predicted lipoprotein with Yx(FWY)xxD motif
MTFPLARPLLISALLLATPAFAEGVTVVTPGVDGAVTTEGAVVVPPGSTIVLQPGDAVTLTQTAPVNVGLEGIVSWGTTTKGPAWVDIKGMALYSYDPDTAGRPTCTGDCATAWPPLVAAKGVEGVGEWTSVARQDGTQQWAFRGHPLYTFVKDTMPGEVNGDGVAGFHLAD